MLCCAVAFFVSVFIPFASRSNTSVSLWIRVFSLGQFDGMIWCQIGFVSNFLRVGLMFLVNCLIVLNFLQPFYFGDFVVDLIFWIYRFVFLGILEL